jgi:hypothetical protein
MLSTPFGYPGSIGRLGANPGIVRLCMLAIAIASATFPDLGRSEERPQPPQFPASTAECETFKQRHLAFANSVTQKSIEGSRRYLLQVKNDEYISFKSSCSQANIKGNAAVGRRS